MTDKPKVLRMEIECRSDASVVGNLVSMCYDPFSDTLRTISDTHGMQTWTTDLKQVAQQDTSLTGRCITAIKEGLLVSAVDSNKLLLVDRNTPDVLTYDYLRSTTADDSISAITGIVPFSDKVLFLLYQNDSGESLMARCTEGLFLRMPKFIDPDYAITSACACRNNVTGEVCFNGYQANPRTSVKKNILFSVFSDDFKAVRCHLIENWCFAKVDTIVDAMAFVPQFKTIAYVGLDGVVNCCHPVQKYTYLEEPFNTGLCPVPQEGTDYPTILVSSRQQGVFNYAMASVQNEGSPAYGAVYLAISHGPILKLRISEK